jgi:hypothetical protein
MSTLEIWVGLVSSNTELLKHRMQKLGPASLSAARQQVISTRGASLSQAVVRNIGTTWSHGTLSLDEHAWVLHTVHARYHLNAGGDVSPLLMMMLICCVVCCLGA